MHVNIDLNNAKDLFCIIYTILMFLIPIIVGIVYHNKKSKGEKQREAAERKKLQQEREEREKAAIERVQKQREAAERLQQEKGKYDSERKQNRLFQKRKECDERMKRIINLPVKQMISELIKSILCKVEAKRKLEILVNKATNDEKQRKINDRRSRENTKQRLLKIDNVIIGIISKDNKSIKNEIIQLCFAEENALFKLYNYWDKLKLGGSFFTKADLLLVISNELRSLKLTKDTILSNIILQIDINTIQEDELRKDIIVEQSRGKKRKDIEDEPLICQNKAECVSKYSFDRRKTFIYNSLICQIIAYKETYLLKHDDLNIDVDRFYTYLVGQIKLIDRRTSEICSQSGQELQESLFSLIQQERSEIYSLIWYKSHKGLPTTNFDVTKALLVKKAKREIPILTKQIAEDPLLRAEKRKLEQEILVKKEAARKKAEQFRKEGRRRKLEQERLAKEKAERKKAEQQKAEQLREEAERKKLEQERLAKEEEARKRAQQLREEAEKRKLEEKREAEEKAARLRKERIEREAREREAKEREARRKQQEEEQKQKKLQDLRSSVSSWYNHSWNGVVKHKWYYDYYSYRDHKDTATSSMWNTWKFVWHFKNDPHATVPVRPSEHKEALDKAVRMVEDTLKETFRDNVSSLTMVCLTASTREKNERRFKPFAERVCSDLNMYNAYSHINITSDGEAKHEGGTGVEGKSYDTEWFKDKYVVLFDDVRTSGTSISNEKRILESFGAHVICSLTLAQTTD